MPAEAESGIVLVGLGRIVHPTDAPVTGSTQESWGIQWRLTSPPPSRLGGALQCQTPFCVHAVRYRESQASGRNLDSCDLINSAAAFLRPDLDIAMQYIHQVRRGRGAVARDYQA